MVTTSRLVAEPDSFAARRSPTQRAGDGRRHPEDTRQDAAGHPSYRSSERATRDSLAAASVIFRGLDAKFRL